MAQNLTEMFNVLDYETGLPLATRNYLALERLYGSSAITKALLGYVEQNLLFASASANTASFEIKAKSGSKGIDNKKLQDIRDEFFKKGFHEKIIQFLIYKKLYGGAVMVPTPYYDDGMLQLLKDCHGKGNSKTILALQVDDFDFIVLPPHQLSSSINQETFQNQKNNRSTPNINIQGFYSKEFTINIMGRQYTVCRDNIFIDKTIGETFTASQFLNGYGVSILEGATDLIILYELIMTAIKINAQKATTIIVNPAGTDNNMGQIDQNTLTQLQTEYHGMIKRTIQNLSVHNNVITAPLGAIIQNFPLDNIDKLPTLLKPVQEALCLVVGVQRHLLFGEEGGVMSASSVSITEEYGKIINQIKGSIGLRMILPIICMLYASIHKEVITEYDIELKWSPTTAEDERTVLDKWNAITKSTQDAYDRGIISKESLIETTQQFHNIIGSNVALKTSEMNLMPEYNNTIQPE